MSVRALLTDLDRTLTGPDLAPDPRALACIQRLRRDGVLVGVVSGRPLAELARGPLKGAFDGYVAENGAIVHAPALGWMEAVAPGFVVDARHALGSSAEGFAWRVASASGPRRLVAGASRQLLQAGLAHEIAFNAQEGMILPPGVDKGRGAARLLRVWRVDPADAAAIGDGENDVPMLRLAALSAAPAQADPDALAAARVRLAGAYAEGFLELAAVLGRPDARIL